MVFVPALFLAAAHKAMAPLWTPEDRKRVIAFWQEPGRYKVEPTSKYVVRLTSQGSTWLWNYDRGRGLGKVAPGTVAEARDAEEASWEKWINAKVAYDRYQAGCAAEVLNSHLTQTPPKYPLEVPAPGAAPSALITKFGKPPAFAANVLPNKYTIQFDQEKVEYVDNVDMRPRYQYYRFDTGVNAGGTSLAKVPSAELEGLWRMAGIAPNNAKIWKTISNREGGFESVNTYDTGFVSVGFIQFASLASGSGSLGECLAEYKRTDAIQFQKDFQQYGVDVTADGRLAVIDVDNDIELTGEPANDRIISDKRLIAVFQRAGMFGSFRAAQVRAAQARFWPMNDKVTVKIGLKTFTGVVSDVIRSEAGKAVLLDRKVNLGNTRAINDVLQAIAAVKPIEGIQDFSFFEALIIKCLEHRYKPDLDDTLVKPSECEMIPSVLRKFGKD